VERLFKGEAYLLTGYGILYTVINYAEAVLKFAKLNTVAQQREAVAQGRSLLPYRLRYTLVFYSKITSFFFRPFRGNA
jgi:hypothetical protein